MADDNEFDDGLVNAVRAAMWMGVGDLTPSPTLLPGLRTRYARQVAVRRTGMAAVPLAVAVVVGAVAVTPKASTPSATTPSATTSQSTQQMQDAAYVTGQVAKALDNADHDVVSMKMTDTSPDGKDSRPGKPATYNKWAMGDSSAFRVETIIDGKPIHDFFFGQTDGAYVDYPNRRWWRYEGGVAGSPTNTGVLTPTEIKQAMSSGKLNVVGQGEVVNGQSTIQLRGDDVIPMEGPCQFWVNESTYLPIRFEYQTGNGWSDPNDLTWLPPTAENLALLKSPIPAGFTQVPHG